MSLSDDERAMLLAVVDRILPPERAPGVQHGPVVAEIERRLTADLAERAADLQRWLGWLWNESIAVFGDGFLSLHASTRDELLDRVEAQNVRCAWTVEPTAFFGELIQWVAAAYEGTHPS
jgi:hypothetical protein